MKKTDLSRGNEIIKNLACPLCATVSYRYAVPGQFKFINVLKRTLTVTYSITMMFCNYDNV